MRIRYYISSIELLPRPLKRALVKYTYAVHPGPPNVFNSIILYSVCFISLTRMIGRSKTTAHIYYIYIYTTNARAS